VSTGLPLRLPTFGGLVAFIEPWHRGAMTTAMAPSHHVHNPALSADVYPDDELVQELTASMRSRLAVETHAPDLEVQVRSTLQELAPVHVTNYLGVLVERRLRGNGQVTRNH
jgi:hypothetical protein